jgi:hypothetical protein
MAQADLFMSEVGSKTAFWLRSHFGGSVTKNTANLLEISERQAKRILAGGAPTSEQLGILARRFGWRFVNFVMEPAVGSPAIYAAMEASEERIAQRVAERLAYEAEVLEAVRAGRANGGGDSDVGGPDATAPVSRPERAA